MQPTFGHVPTVSRPGRCRTIDKNRDIGSAVRWASLWALFSCLLMSPGGLLAEGGKSRDAYHAVWDEVSELVKRREYGSALAKLDALAKERDLRDHARQIEADRKAMTGLQTLQRIVSEQAATLEPGSTIEISGVEYTVVQFETSARSDVLVLKTKSLGRETKKPILDLPSGTWVELAEADLASLEHPELTLGIFLAFDRIPDRKGARKLLNEAAAKGDEMTVWLERLEESEKNPSVAKKSKKDGQGGGTGQKDEPVVVSTWAHQVMKDGKVIKRQTFKLYSNGKINHPESLATWQIKGNLLLLTWPTPMNPAKTWKDVLTLSANRKAYVGKNQEGFTLAGVLLGEGDIND